MSNVSTLSRRDQALSIACPDCDAQPGQACVLTEDELSRPHPDALHLRRYLHAVDLSPVERRIMYGAMYGASPETLRRIFDGLFPKEEG